MLNVCQGRSFSELLTILICVLRPVNIFQLWNADETNFSLFQLCMPTWLSTTQLPCQLLPTWNPEQQDRSDWPLSVPAVSSTLCLSARCQSTLWAYAFYNSHDPIFFICTVSVFWFHCSLSNTGTGGIQRPPLSCFAGHYCPVGTMFPTQHKCPAGTWNDRSGLESESECRPCPRGWYCLAGVGVPSGRCSSGYYCPEGSTWLTILIIGLFFSFAHIKMKINLQQIYINTINSTYFFIDLNWNNTMKFFLSGTMYGTQFPCPRGTYSIKMGNGGKEDCVVCPEGYYCQEGSSKPIPCPP